VNGSTLTLGLVGALAVGAALGRRGSRSASYHYVQGLLEGCDEGLYHVTRTRLIPSIRARGLIPSPARIKPTFDYFSESGHLTGQVFLAAGIPAAAEWWNTIRMVRKDERRVAPLSLLRVRPDRVSAYAKQLRHDEEGASDVHVCSFSLRGKIAPEDLEVARPSAAFGRTMNDVMGQIWDAQGGIRLWARPFVWVPLVGEGSHSRLSNYRYFHVTTHRAANAILRDGFRPNPGICGPGVYLWDDRFHAEQMAQDVGEDAVILAVDPEQTELHACNEADVQGEGDSEYYEHVVIVRTKSAWKPRMRVLE